MTSEITTRNTITIHTNLRPRNRTEQYRENTIMKGAVTFYPASHTGTNTVTYVGDFVVDNLAVSGNGVDITLTADGLAEFRTKVNSIAAGRHEAIGN